MADAARAPDRRGGGRALGGIARRGRPAGGARPTRVEPAAAGLAARSGGARGRGRPALLGQLALAGDVAHWLGRPRWHGVAVAAGGGLLLAVLPGGGRIAFALALLALGALAVSALALVQASGTGPLEAWDRVASRAAFRFSASSPWVTTGRALDRVASNGAGLVFDEEHRVTAASAGALRVRSQDGARTSAREWEMGPGQSVTLRPGDRLEAASGVRVRFEAGRRVPGAPVSGAAWARAGAPDLALRLGLGLTLVGGAVAVLRPRRRQPRSAALLGGAALLAVLLWAEAWALYGALTVPELLLAADGLARVLDLPGLALGEGPGEPYLALLVISALASFLASTVGLGPPSPGSASRPAGHPRRRPVGGGVRGERCPGPVAGGPLGADPAGPRPRGVGSRADPPGPSAVWLGPRSPGRRADRPRAVHRVDAVRSTRQRAPRPRSASRLSPP